ncbi:serine hydrolase [Microbacterium sp.]|uniref:serine hydrolase n=1 Tax=Microbacterium sp. TaxID=51671 RepID=UPI002CEFDDD8|nr:serine hydrolase [Microbacterium sp.]HWL76306.1 serine hydrolase [Microbacterium sp.]
MIHPRGQRRWWSRALLAIALTPVVLLAQVAPATAGADDSASGSAVSNEAPAPDSTEAPAPEPSESTPTPSDSTEPTPTPDPSPTEIETPEPVPSEEPTPEADPDEEPDDPSADARLFAAGTPGTIPAGTRVSLSTNIYTASVAATTATFPNGSDVVVLTGGSAPIMGTIAATLIASTGGALLLTQPSAMPANVWAELQRLAPSSVYIVGGSGVVSEAVADRVRSIVPNVQRIGSNSASDTARLIFEAGTVAADTVYLSGGITHDDAPLATAAGARAGKRTLIVNGQAAAVEPATLAALRAVGTTRIVHVAGTSRVSAGYEASLRAAGFDFVVLTHSSTYHLSARVASEPGSTPQRSLVVNPARPSDLAVAAGIAAATGQPLFYSLPECIADAIAAQISASGARVLALGDTEKLMAPAMNNVPCTVEKSNRQAALTSAIRSTLSQYPGTYTVTVRQIGGLNEIAQIGGGTRMEPASMMKIFASWAALKLIDQGRATINTRLPSGISLGLCIQFMIHVSDNYCHTDVVHWIGIPRINQMIRDAGFTNTYYGNVPAGVSVLYAGNRTSTNDITWMMQRLANRSILSKKWADHLIILMRSQIWRSRIASGIPPGIGQASKPGALWLTSGLLQADTAIVNGTRYSYIISIIGDNGPPQEALRAVSRTVYTHFNGAFGAAATYPIHQMVTRTPSLLRASPNGAIVTTIPAGVLIQVLDAQRMWYQIQWGQRKLWVSYTGLKNR